jgi:hypothetical protein
MRHTVDLTGGWPITVLLQPISDISAINPLVAFYDIHEEKRCYSFILSRTPHETKIDGKNNNNNKNKFNIVNDAKKYSPSSSLSFMLLGKSKNIEGALI